MVKMEVFKIKENQTGDLEEMMVVLTMGKRSIYQDCHLIKEDYKEYVQRNPERTQRRDQVCDMFRKRKVGYKMDKYALSAWVYTSSRLKFMCKE